MIIVNLPSLQDYYLYESRRKLNKANPEKRNNDDDDKTGLNREYYCKYLVVNRNNAIFVDVKYCYFHIRGKTFLFCVRLRLNNRE